MTANDYIDRMGNARLARAEKLARDPVFFDETKQIQDKLNAILRQYPGLFARFFREFSGLSVRLQSVELRDFLQEIPEAARNVFEEYIAYARRFRVWFSRRQGSFRIRPTGPWQSKFHARLVDGFLRDIYSEEPGVEALVSERFVDDDLKVPTAELELLVARGGAKIFQLDDGTGKSVLHEIEDSAYDPESITFILHKGIRDYLFCLVGENVPVDSLWRDAGKAVTSLQRQLYKRTRGGRPRKFEKWERAIRLREQPDGKPLKEKAYELLNAPEARPKNLRSAQSFLSKAAKRSATPKKAGKTKPTLRKARKRKTTPKKARKQKTTQTGPRRKPNRSK